MAREGGSPKVRVVRCPKCENLLSELPNYSVYECGGCGALLRAKKKVTANGGLLEKLAKERDGEGFEKLETLSEIEVGSTDLDVAVEVEREKGDGVFLDRGKERVFQERTFKLVSDYRETSIDCSSRIVKQQTLDYQRSPEKGIAHNDKYKVPLKHSVRNWVGQDDNDMNRNRSESVSSSREKEIGKSSSQFKGSVGSLRSRANMGKWNLDRDGLGGPLGNIRMGDDRSRYSKFVPYPDEGPSNYNYYKTSSYGHGHPSYGHGHLVRNFDDPDGPTRFAHLEQDRAVLLRKLDELKEQICRSSSVIEKQRGTAAVDVKIAPSGVHGHDRVPYYVPVKPLAPDKHVPRPSYFRQNGYQHVVSTSNQETDMHNFYVPQKHNPNEFPVYKEPIQPQMPRLGSRQQPGYLQQPLLDCYIGTHMDFDREHLASYPRQMLHHDPACPCFHCYKKWHVPSHGPVSLYGHKHILEEPTDSNFNHHVNPIKFRSPNCTAQVNQRAVHVQDPQSHVIWPTDIDSDIDALRQSRPTKGVTAHGYGHICHPIAGAAPFIACYSCFELLKLPRKLKAREKNQQKLRCGACSTLLLVEIRNKKIIITIPVEKKQLLAEANHVSCEVSKAVSSSVGDFSAEGMNCSDNLSYDFQSADFKEITPPKDQKLNFRTRYSLASLSPISSSEEEITDSMIVHRDVSDFPELSSKDNASPTLQHSLSPEHLDDISPNHKVNRNVEGNKSNRTEKEKVRLEKTTCQQNSVNDGSSETEVEVSFNGFLNTTTSQDSEVSKEDLQPRINKSSESFLVGLLKKSFRDFSRSSGKFNVSVNRQPIPDSMVKRAEKLAGPIRPGDYWYDSQAGFWGVMGQPCLGIIPPFIKEFNYPMPKNCSAGNSGVFVNGRELHQKDLDLLASRGLPTTKESSYIVEISGRVVEKDSGEVLKSLGKLAPTIERMKRGFGMKVPRNLI